MASVPQAPKDGICTSCVRSGEGWLREGAAGHRLAAARFYVWFCRSKGRVKGQGRGILWRKMGVGESSSIPVGAKKLQEEGEDIDNV